MIKHSLIAIDLAKNVFQVCGMTKQRKIVFNKQLKRKDLPPFMAKQEPGCSYGSLLFKLLLGSLF